jgi:hypothetical protein
MTKPKGPQTFHEEQRAILSASIAALRVDGRFSTELCDKLNELSERVFETTVYQFMYGEPEQYQKGTATLTTLMETINEILANAKRKK